ncbi:MAG TPA: anti-sigma factor [Candidatus Angelobacter sp.]
MQFSEDDLRTALKPKDPGPGFTQRVMARVGQQEKSAPARKPRRAWFAWLQPLRLHPAMAAVVAVLILAVGSLIGYRQHQERERQQAMLAEQKAVEALRITNAKLNHVFRRVRQSEASEPKIRKEVL